MKLLWGRELMVEYGRDGVEADSSRQGSRTVCKAKPEGECVRQLRSSLPC